MKPASLALAPLLALAASSGCGPSDSPAAPPSPAWRENRYQTGLESSSLAPDERLRRAEELLRQERLAEAAAEFRKVLDKDAKHVDALVGLGRVAERMGDAASSLGFLSRAASLRPDDASIVNHLAVTFVMNGRRAEAAQAFDRALQLRPEDARVMLNAALNRADLSEWERAHALAKRAAELLPKDAMPWLVLGRLEVRQGRPAQALPYFREAARREPNEALVQYHLGKTLVAAGQAVEGKEILRRLLSSNAPPDVRKEVEELIRK